jgi:protein phosphatase methylesterase 1
MHHGAGSSGLSFATCAEEIRRIIPDAGILSADARDHGSTSVTRASEDGDADPAKAQLDLSLDTLNHDLLFVIRETQKEMGWDTLPDIVLVGHSLGGAVITDVASKGELGTKLLAYAVLDVVEGMLPLHSDNPKVVNTELRNRIRDGCPPEYGNISLHSTVPLSLSSLGDRMAVCLSSELLRHTFANEDHLHSTRSRTIRNRTSARVSVPSLLYYEDIPKDSSNPWVWRTNLAETKPFWEDWFVGLSKKFLEARGGKLLLLAGTDRLDKELMIGQMQGVSFPPSPLPSI